MMGQPAPKWDALLPDKQHHNQSGVDLLEEI